MIKFIAIFDIEYYRKIKKITLRPQQNDYSSRVLVLIQHDRKYCDSYSSRLLGWIKGGRRSLGCKSCLRGRLQARNREQPLEKREERREANK